MGKEAAQEAREEVAKIARAAAQRGFKLDKVKFTQTAAAALGEEQEQKWEGRNDEL